MVARGRLLVSASILALGLCGCSKPATVAAPSDPPALVEPASASGADPAPSSSIQTADAASAPSTGGGCHQVQVGGGYQAGANGGPGVMTPGQTMTVCSAPTPTPAPHAVAATPAAPARAEPAAPDTD